MSTENENFENERLDELIADHEKKAKRINKRDLSTKPNTLKRYEYDILTAHNEIVSYINKFIEDFDKNSEDKVVGELEFIRAKTQKCCERLEIVVNFPDNVLEKLKFEKRYESTDSLLSVASSVAATDDTKSEQDKQSKPRQNQSKRNCGFAKQSKRNCITNIDKPSGKNARRKFRKTNELYAFRIANAKKL